MNRAEFIGRLTKDPELTTTNSGLSVCKITVAVNRRFKKDGENEADFFNVVAWRQLGENIAKYCHKGSKVFIAGELQNRSYDAQDGAKRYITEIIANECEFLDTKQNNDSQENNESKEQEKELEPIDDADLPF